ncbi:MAG: 4Fe-4S binding protein [Spirochaetales bacterium]|nr:4Fe-4S binding protein [Spirochaetales bacterium]
MINIKINSVPLEVEEGTTILEAAKKGDTPIPTLCHHPALDSFGACRLCVVEIHYGKRVKIVTSCNYEVWDGLEVFTDTDRVRKSRAMTLELLLARCPDVRMIKDLAREYGVKQGRFSEESDNCILCGLCVRICKERMGVGAADFVGRGVDMKIDTPYSRGSDACLACGACVTVCPTGAIDLEKRFSRNEPVPLKSVFNAGMSTKPVIATPFPQAVPNIPVIDSANCVYLRTGGCRTCETFCEAKAIDYDQKDETVEVDVGTIIAATGFDLYNPEEKPEYGYGKYPEVITGLEFERLVSASGPTGGKILINGKEPRKVVFIQCVGSREEGGKREYCSRVCCMYTAKHAHLVKERLKDAEISIFYTDLRAFGKGYEEFVNRVKDEGTTYRRRELNEPIEVTKKKGKLTVTAKGHPALEADMVILATAVVPREDSLELARKLNISLSPDGFFLEAHPKLKPVETLTGGIFLAGCAQGPKDIPDTVSQASGAASRAISILSKDTIMMEAITAAVNEAKCRGCGLCVEICPFNAIELKEINRLGYTVKVASVNEALCKGCGSCSAACLSQAVQQKGFTDTQILEAIRGIV